MIPAGQPWPAARTVPDMLSRLFRAGRIKGYSVSEYCGGPPIVQINYLNEKGELRNSRQDGTTIEEDFAKAIIGLPAVKEDTATAEFLMMGPHWNPPKSKRRHRYPRPPTT